MKLTPKISIEEIDNKIYRSNSDYNLENDSAIITHYLHNRSNGVSEHYKQYAKKAIKAFLKFKSDKENIKLKAEESFNLLQHEVENVPFPSPDNYKFTFIDLFAGVGGFRIAMQNVKGKCIYTSEWNIDAQKTYRANFGEVPFGDITIDTIKKYIPNTFDVLCAGFPCQAFSVAGYRKGFADTRGTLFFDIEQIVEKHRPKVVFLENVKNLVTHDKGNTFKIIVDILENKLGYKVFSKVLNSMNYANIPQNRERIFIVAIDPKQVINYNKFTFPTEIKLTKTIHDFLEVGKQNDIYYYRKDHIYYSELEKTMTSKNTVYQWRRFYVRENKSNVCPTLTANMGAGGHNVPLILDDFGIRKLTPKECFALQGYPIDKFILPNISNSKLYVQAGNSVTTSLVERISNEIVKIL